MNIIKRELKSKRKTFLIWSIIMVSFALLGFSEGGAFVGESSVDIQALMESMPEELMKAFSMEGFDMATAEGYYGIMVAYFALALAIYSVMTGCSTVVSEERDKTVEFSLVLPIKRHQLLSSKLFVVFLYGVALNIITALCTFAFGAVVSADKAFYDFVLLSSLAILIIQVLYMALGFFIGCVFKNHKKAGSLSVSILLATYFFSMFAGMHEKLEFFKYLTPFKFFDFYKIFESNSLDLMYVIISFVLTTAFIVAGFVGYQKRDIHI